MEQVIQLLLAGVARLAPLLTTNAAVTTAIDVVTQAIPLIVQEVKDVLPVIANAKEAIDALRANKATTPEQITTLDELSKQCDAIYDAADKPQPGDPDYVEPSTGG